MAAGAQDAMILDFLMERADGRPAKLDDIRGPLEDAFHAVLRGEAESDGFNRLVIGAGLAWRDVTILRAVGKFLRQAGHSPSARTIWSRRWSRNPDIAALLVALFHARNDPDATAIAKRASRTIETPHRDRAAAMCPAWMTTASSAASAM